LVHCVKSVISAPGYRLLKSSSIFSRRLLWIGSLLTLSQEYIPSKVIANVNLRNTLFIIQNLEFILQRYNYIVIIQKREIIGKYIELNIAHPFYEYKIKRYLTDIALGVMPSEVWTGELDATGGSLIVRSDGEVLCYHIYNRNEFEDFLLNNTKL